MTITLIRNLIFGCIKALFEMMSLKGKNLITSCTAKYNTIFHTFIKNVTQVWSDTLNRQSDKKGHKKRRKTDRTMAQKTSLQSFAFFFYLFFSKEPGKDRTILVSHYRDYSVKKTFILFLIHQKFC